MQCGRRSAIQRALGGVEPQERGQAGARLRASPSNSGPVVVDATGEIFGDVPNIAARAQALAEPGTVVVTARVQRQVAGLFVAEDRGSHDAQGVPEPVTLYRVVRASGGGRRAGQRHLTPLVGRDEEIAMLLRRWERARLGDGQLVLVVGEPGLGKSRLIEEFHARLCEVPHTWVEWSCSQLLQNTPLHPVIEWGRERFGGSDVLAELRLADLEGSLTQVKLEQRGTGSRNGRRTAIPARPTKASGARAVRPAREPKPGPPDVTKGSYPMVNRTGTAFCPAKTTKVISEMESLMAMVSSWPVAKPCAAPGKMDVCRVRGRAQSASPCQLVGDRRRDEASRGAQ